MYLTDNIFECQMLKGGGRWSTPQSEGGGDLKVFKRLNDKLLASLPHTVSNPSSRRNSFSLNFLFVLCIDEKLVVFANFSFPLMLRQKVLTFESGQLHKFR